MGKNKTKVIKWQMLILIFHTDSKGGFWKLHTNKSVINSQQHSRLTVELIVKTLRKERDNYL